MQVSIVWAFVVLSAVNLSFTQELTQQMPAGEEPAAPVSIRTTFHIHYISGNNVYVDGGRAAGLTEGTKLILRGTLQQPASVTAAKPAAEEGESNYTTLVELRVVALAETSAICEIVFAKQPVAVGQTVTLPRAEVEKIVEKQTLGSTRNYPAVVSFTEGDPMDEDVRELIPRPPLPEVNRAKGRIGFDFSTIHAGGGLSSSSTMTGMMVEADVTRIGGSHWNLSGYWRGRLDSTSGTGQQTLQDLINRTYHMSLTYVNPDSRWVAGFGRLYLPWASSLETIDGGYFGRKLSKRVTAGLFGGSTPDPTSYSYSLDRHLAGTFFNISGGSYDDVHYSSTWGIGLNMLKSQVDRPFVYTENEVSYKTMFSLYEALQIDKPHTGPGVTAVNAGLGRSFVTARFQPVRKLSFDFNHNYFRDVPTYDPQLVGTGLLDKYLFQGFSGGVRVDIPAQITLYTTIGRSSTNSDTKSSWNEMYGITLNRIWKTGLRLDARYSKFDSAFAQGNYRSFSLSRNFGDPLRIELQGGLQKFVSPLSKDSGSRFMTASVDYLFGPHYFFQAGFTLDRGDLQRYNQIYTTVGYRFDNRNPRRNRTRIASGSSIPSNAETASSTTSSSTENTNVAKN